MPAEFANLGVRFQYPENWVLTRDTDLTDCRSVTVTSPGGAFWTLSIHPRSADPRQLVEAVVHAMREEYKELENEPVQEDLAGHQLVGQDFNFYCLDLTNTAHVRSLRGDREAYTIFCQAEDREFDRVANVFRAMTASLLANICPKPHNP